MSRAYRPIFVALLLTGLMVLPGAVSARAAEEGGAPAELLVYFGTYTRGEKSKGIYVARLDRRDGKLREPELAAELKNPSFVAIHPNRRFLYAVGEMYGPGGKGGAVSALAIDPKSGRLNPLNQQSSGGPGPCHVTVDPSGRCVLVANYGGGSVACLPIGEDGRLKEAASFIQHEGSSVDPRRQKGPHAHSVNCDAAGRFAFVADLGLDKVMIYRLDAANGKLHANDPAFASVEPGSGPRHFDFHPSGRFACVINELASTITAFSYDASKGALEAIHTLSTLPEGFDGKNTTAEVQVHPSGRFAYGSNRGHDSIAIFAVDGDSGRLTPVGHQSTGGRTPRNFGIDPSGAYLLAANQDSDNVVAFRIDQDTGRLAPTGQELKVGRPVCVEFLSPPR